MISDVSDLGTEVIIRLKLMKANLTAHTLAAEPRPEEIVLPPEYAGPSQRTRLAADGFARICAQTDAWAQDLKQSYGLHG